VSGAEEYVFEEPEARPVEYGVTIHLELHPEVFNNLTYMDATSKDFPSGTYAHGLLHFKHIWTASLTDYLQHSVVLVPSDGGYFGFINNYKSVCLRSNGKRWGPTFCRMYYYNFRAGNCASAGSVTYYYSDYYIYEWPEARNDTTYPRTTFTELSYYFYRSTPTFYCMDRKRRGDSDTSNKWLGTFVQYQFPGSNYSTTDRGFYTGDENIYGLLKYHILQILPGDPQIAVQNVSITFNSNS